MWSLLFKSKIFGGILGLGIIIYGLTYVYDWVYDKGVHDTKIEYDKVAAANQRKIDTLNQEIVTLNRIQQNKVSNLITQIKEAYERGLNENTNRSTNTIIDDANTTGGLSVPITSSDNQTCSSESSGGASATEGNNVESRAQLSDEASRFFIEQAKRADDIVNQLTACQKLVNVYYGHIQQYRSAINKLD